MNISEPGSYKDLYTYVLRLNDWDTLIRLFERIKRTTGSVEIPGGSLHYIGGGRGKQSLIKIFRKKICTYNSSRTMREDIRSIFTGRVTYPGTSTYSKTLRLCRLRRYYSTCKEIVGRDSFTHPITGKRVLRSSLTGKRLTRKCSI